MVVCTRKNMTADDHVAAFVRDGRIRQGDSAEDMMMMMLRCLRNEMTCVGLEEYMYPNCLLVKAMKEGKIKLIKTSSKRYRTCHCCDGGGSWTYDYETPSGLSFQVYYCYTSVTGWEAASDSGREAEEDVRVFFLWKEDQDHGRSEASRVRDETFFPRGLCAVERCQDCLPFYEVVD